MPRTVLARSALAGLALSVLPVFAADTAPAAPAAASETISRFHGELAAAMTQSKLGCEGRIGKLTPAVDATFDLPFITERAMRRHWKKLDETQRRQFAEALRSSVITTYATEFSTPGSVSFETGESELLANGDALVHASLTARGEKIPVTLDYQLKPHGDGWQVVNVLAEGVSDLALRASQYDTTIKAQGFTVLLDKLDAQTKALRARCS